jgi:PAS domain S-box-containing protein
MDPAKDPLGGAVLDALDSGLAILDPAGRVLGWNHWLASASGIPTSDALGKTIEELFPGRHMNRLNMAVASALEMGASSLLSHALHPHMLPLKTRAGRPLLHNLAVRPLGEKPHSGCLIQVADVTVTTEREGVLRQRLNARYDAVVGSAPDAILTFDAHGDIQMANPAAEREFGYLQSELLNRPIGEFLEEASAWEAAFSALLAGDDVPWPLELVVRRKDGSRSFVDISASRWLSDSRVFVTAIFREVNARRAAEAELRHLNETLEVRVLERTGELQRAHEQLRQSQKMEAIGQLTGGVAHDFNNLLTPILGGLDILQRRGMPDERSQRLLDGAIQSAERARVLVQRLLAFARRQPLRPGRVDVAELVGDMTELFGSTLGVRTRLVSDLPDELPAVMADRNQLEMALLNLAVNARDAMPEGGTLTIAADARTVRDDPQLSAGAYVRLAVVDTGVGMDAETLRRATEPFFSTKGVGKGTGLGLSMIHGLAAQLGGTLEITSAPGLGTAVAIWLPVATGDAAGAPQPVAESEKISAAGVVLLVDDEDLVRTSTAQMLADLGYSVVEASSASEALPYLDDSRISLIITDHLMPGMTGAELAREARGRGSLAPVLIISGYAELDQLAPDFAHLTKPFREAELSAALKSLFQEPGDL